MSLHKTLHYTAWIITVGGVVVGGWSHAVAQSSSLYLAEPEPPVVRDGRMVYPEMRHASYTRVPLPPPRTFNVHDLITIIVRQKSTAASESSLETEKDVNFEGEIAEFPHLTLQSLLEFQLKETTHPENNPGVDIGYTHDYEGEGEYERRDKLIARLTAEVIDVKPNGNLVLAARTYIKTDSMERSIEVTGVCRAQDVTADNSILSTQLFNLHIEKVHHGALRESSEKGLITQILELIFNF